MSAEKLLAGISHLMILAGIFGIVGALFICFWQKDKSRLTSEHAKQAAGYQIVVYLLFVIIDYALPGFKTATGWGGISGVNIISLIFLLYAVYGAYMGFISKEFRYALIGDFVARI